MEDQAQSIVLIKANKLRLINSTYRGNHDSVLVKTIATTITPGMDRLLLTNKPVSHKVLNYPIMLGSEMIGQVIATAPGVTSVSPGDFVYTFKGDCWRDVEPYYGCHAETVATSESCILPLGRPPVHRDLLTGLLGYVISGIDKCRLGPSSRVLILGLGSVGLMTAEYLNSLGITNIDALENFGIRGQLSSARSIAMDMSDFNADFNDRYDLIIEATGRILLVEKAVRMLRQGAQVLLLGNYEVLGYDYRLMQHKEPLLICSSITTRQHLERAREILDKPAVDTEKFFTHVFPVDQYELAYRIALDSKEAIKTVISWV
ncbi:MAG TPA: zinc-binding alcohol dehydrogenase [Prosthecochloris aestuarii]|uniref:Zinc-binding alcohol dehydrogenase n=1 Tax=Prosthecochloris aestuarii TaxID=1102 RepID=A0A831SRH6_PROAE|nr:zinc-binding alcohol dehydrogenase [Prosthecochloris aestuarii]